MDPNDALNERLHTAGDAIAVGDDFSALNNTHDGARTRRSRRRAIAGIGATVLLVAGGVVAFGVLGEDEPDSLSIAGTDELTSTTIVDESAAEAAETDESTQDTTDEAVAGTVALPATTVPAATNSAVAFETIDATATLVPVPADLRDAQLNWVVPWQGGFLASRTLIVPQALPSELPDEIAALFPQEVIDFFDGELPPTIDEATQMLSEAGLLDEVTAVLAEHPEANEVIFSQPTTLPSVSVEYSADGVEWEPVDFAMPDGSQYLQSVQSTGDRLVAVIQDFAEPVDVGLGVTPTIEIAVTTDLVTWNTVALPSLEPAAGLPSFASVSTYPNSLAVGESGWVASVGVSYEVDVQQLVPLLPAELAEEYDPDSGGYGGAVTPEGVTLYLFEDYATSEPLVEEPPADEPPPRPEPQTITLTWEELGVDPGVAASLDISGSALVSGSWTGETTVVDDVDVHRVVGASEGFYAVAEGVSFSPDGASWVELATPAPIAFVQNVLSLDRGVVVFGIGDEGERQAFRVDGPLDNWTAIQVPELPSSFGRSYFGDGSDSQALVVDVADVVFAEEQPVTVEVDGYTMTFTSGETLAGFRLVDSTGTVVIDDQFPSQAEPPDYLRNDEDGFTFVDVDSGEDIVTVSFEQLSAGYESLPQESFEEPVPELWVLATLDGERWLFEDLDVDENDAYFGASPLAINGTTLLVAVGAEWQVFDLS